MAWTSRELIDVLIVGRGVTLAGSTVAITFVEFTEFFRLGGGLIASARLRGSSVLNKHFGLK